MRTFTPVVVFRAGEGSLWQRPDQLSAPRRPGRSFHIIQHFPRTLLSHPRGSAVRPVRLSPCTAGVRAFFQASPPPRLRIYIPLHGYRVCHKAVQQTRRQRRPGICAVDARKYAPSAGGDIAVKSTGVIAQHVLSYTRSLRAQCSPPPRQISSRQTACGLAVDGQREVGQFVAV